jgi:hypothetical protein
VTRALDCFEDGFPRECKPQKLPLSTTDAGRVELLEIDSQVLAKAVQSKRWVVILFTQERELIACGITTETRGEDMPAEPRRNPLAARALTASAVSSAQNSTIDSLQSDGMWCPMAHSNQNVSSFQDVPPLLKVSKPQKITNRAVSFRGFVHLGSFTGEMMAVCVYASPYHPALVAYDYPTINSLPVDKP